MNKQSNDYDNNFIKVCHFLIKIGEAAHRYGATSTRLELYLHRLSSAFEIEGTFNVTPTEMTFAFQRQEQQPQFIQFIKLPFGGLDLDKLACLGELVDEVTTGSMSIEDAVQNLDEIDTRPPPWGNLSNFLSYVGVGAGIAVLFSGSWWDVFFAAVLSAVVFFMVIESSQFGERTAQWLPLSTAFVCGAVAAIGQWFVPELNLVIVVVSAVIILVPGYSVSLGIAELVAQKTVSGLANLMNGLVYLAKQVTGAWLGAALIVQFLPVVSHPTGSAVDTVWLWVFMPLIILGLCIVFQTSRRDFLWAVLGCVIAYGGILFGTSMLDGNLGNLIGTIVAVVFSNVWSQKTSRPTSIILLPAIVLLVSGSIGFRGLAAMAQGQMVAGEQQFLQMGVVALTIAVGVMVGNTIVKPEATL